MSPKRITKPLDVYIRVSRVGGREGDSFISPELQEERCRALAVAKGLDVGLVFVDLDQSGGKMDRPEFNRALERIREGVSGGILVARIDRFARTMQGALNTLDEITTAGGVVIAADGDFDTTTAMGRFARDMMLRLAELYREQATEGWADSRSNAVRNGIHSGPRAPVGYYRNGERRLHPDPETAPVIVEVFKRRAAGATMGSLATFLREQGVKTSVLTEKEGAKRPGGTINWSESAVRAMIRNRAYVGEARSGDFVNPNAHEPLIEEGLWQAANQATQRGKVAKPRSRGDSEGALLTQLVFCETCGYPMTASSMTSGGKPYRFYTCRNAYRGCEQRASIAGSQVETFIEVAFLTTTWQPVERSPEIDFSGLETAVEAARGALEAWDAFDPVAGGVDVSFYMTKRAEYVQAKTEAETALADAKLEADGVQDLPEVDPITWQALSIPERRTILTQWLRTAGYKGIVVKPGRGYREERCDLLPL